MKLFRISIAILFGAVVLMSCGGKIGKGPFTKIESYTSFEYDMRGSSVGPEYHRSYNLLLKDSTLYFKVRDYDSVLLSEEIKLTKEQMSMTDSLLKESDFSGFVYEPMSGCRNHSMEVSNGSEKVFSKAWTEGESKSFDELHDYLSDILGGVIEKMHGTLNLNEIIEQDSDTNSVVQKEDSTIVE